MELKIAFLLILAGVSSVFATPAYSQLAKVTLDMRNASLESVLDEIESQSEFYFILNQKQIDVNRVVDIKEENKLITDILPELFRGTNVNYLVLDKKILLTTDILENDLLTTGSGTNQQKNKITGTVTDKNGPLPGVNVIVTGTTQGSLTDVSGNYSIDVTQGAKSLTFSFVGMESQEIIIGALTKINVTMVESAIGLEEVVVVGYGTQTKSKIVGSVASVKSNEIKSISTDNIVTGLAGMLPGLTVVQRSGEPGTFNTVFNIRGYGTPLIVVDGIVRSDFTKFEPEDIESISVLKDAAASIYGVQAANGVILVSTKKGNIGKPVISYSTYYQWQKFTVVPKVCNAYEFAILTVENDIAAGKAPGSTTYSTDDLQKFKDGTYPSTDWLGAIQRDFTTLMNHNLSISGGNEKVKYFTSMGYMDETGIWKSDNLWYKKYNVSSSVTINVTDNLKAQINIDGILEDKNNASLANDNIYYTALLAQPTTPLYANNNPRYLQLVNPENVLADISADYSGYSKTKNKTFQGNFSLDYKFKKINGLSARFLFGFYNQDIFQKDWRKLYYVYTYNKTTDTYTVAGSGKWTPTSLYENYSPLQKSTVLGQLTYNKLFLQKHQVKADIIFESRHDKNDNLNANKFFSIDVDQMYAGLATNTTASSSNITENANQNVIGRLNYDYLSKYLLEVGFNYSGSSKFPKEKRWGFFPYASVGWRVSEEKFIKDNFPYVDGLKFRGSLGKMGDDAASSFQFITGYNYPTGNFIFGTDIIPGLGFRALPNPNITWFTATTKNIGLDLSLFKGLISFEFDIFQRDRSGLLATRSISLPATVGASLAQENLNSDRRKGFEFVIGSTKKLGELTYNISGSLQYNRGQQNHVERAKDGNLYLNWRNNTNDRLTDITWGYKYIGQYQTAEEIMNSPIVDGQGNRTLRPGDLKYEDVNNDGMINSLDQVPIALSNIPAMQFGLNITLSWKNFDMRIFAQGASNYSFRYMGQLQNPLQWSRQSLRIFMDRWHREDIYDVNSAWIPGKYPAIGWPASNTWMSNFILVDAYYVRLKNLEIGYTIAYPFLKTIGVQNVRINVTGANFLTWSNVKNNDPEQTNSSFYSYPLNKTLSLGLNVTF